MPNAVCNSNMQNALPQSATLAEQLNIDHRCQHRYANQKRCRLNTQRLDTRFCVHHLKFYQPSEVAAALTSNLAELKSPEALNDFLSRLLLLLAQNKISPRRAAVLGYITNQLLRTIHAIDQKALQARRDEENADVQVNVDVSRPTWDAHHDLPEDDPNAPHNAMRRFIANMPRPERDPLPAPTAESSEHLRPNARARTSRARTSRKRATQMACAHQKTKARIGGWQIGSSREDIRRRSAYATLQNKNEALGRITSASHWLLLNLRVPQGSPPYSTGVSNALSIRRCARLSTERNRKNARSAAAKTRHLRRQDRSVNLST